MKKHLREGLKVLDSSYSIKNIDFEDCLYKDLGNGIDFEISHGNKKYTIFIWLHKGRVIETLSNIPLSDLKETLDNAEKKYINFGGVNK